MVFIEKLKSIFPALPSEAYHYEIKLDASSPKSTKSYSLDSANKHIVIYINKLSPKEERLLKKHIIDGFKEDNLHFIAESKVSLLDKLYKYNSKDDNQTLNFFKPILSRSDWNALRDSLFLRSEFNKHENIALLKKDIVSRYGDRGNVISNICTAGYFEKTMMPLCKSSQREFYRYYDMAVDRGVTALFVNAGMSIEKISSEIKRIIVSAKAYGLGHIHIHGIGEKNIKKIQSCISKEKGNMNFTEKTIFDDSNLKVLVVEITL